MAGGGTGNWAIVEALGSAVTGGVALAGAAFASRYLKRANATVEANYFSRPAGGGLDVKHCIQSSSLVRLRLDYSEERYAPHLLVTPVELVNGEEGPRRALRKACYGGDQHLLDPGETVAGSETVLVPAVDRALLGWRVEFVFTVRLRRRKLEMTMKARPPTFKVQFLRRRWYWTAETFVPAPHPGWHGWTRILGAGGH